MTEEELFARHVPPGKRVLDLGASSACARLLAPRAASYVSLGPNDDASDLSEFSSEAFDVAIFPGQGLGAFTTNAVRRRCVAECSRVVPQGGQLLFSLANPRHLLSRKLPARLRSRAFWMGQGFLKAGSAPPVFECTPARMAFEVERANFVIRESWPASAHVWDTARTPFVFYVCERR